MTRYTVTELIQPLVARLYGYPEHKQDHCLKIFVLCVEWEREQDST